MTFDFDIIRMRAFPFNMQLYQRIIKEIKFKYGKLIFENVSKYNKLHVLGKI